MKKINIYNVGDEVLLREKNVSDASEKKIAKLYDVWSGPYYIGKQVSEHTFILVDKETKVERGMFHASLFKRYEN